MPIKPIAPPGKGSNIKPTITPAKIAKKYHACCASPAGAGISAIMMATRSGAKFFQVTSPAFCTGPAAGVGAGFAAGVSPKRGLFIGFSFQEIRNRASFPSDRNHLASEKRYLRRKRQIFRTHVVTCEQRHAAEDPVIIADQFVIIVVTAPIARIQTEASDLVEAHRAREILAHPGGTATGDAAAAFDATVELVDLVCELRLHSFFHPREIDFGFFHMKPGFEALAHAAHPFSCVH